MKYALLQKTLETPPLESLKAAFRGSGVLTPVDAQIVANDAFGILVQRLALDRAQWLQASLANVGVEVEVVPEGSLPQLAPAKFIRRLDLTAERLVTYDPLDRPVPVEWRHVALIAAGWVETTRTRKEAVEPENSTRHFRRHPLLDELQQALEPKFKYTEERKKSLVLELVLAGGAMRFAMEVEPILLSHVLGTERSGNLTSDLARLLQKISACAPHVPLNRGAHCFRENDPEGGFYPTRHAFDEETVWNLWQRQKTPG